jgi:glycerophosphoryl diester phosphodiesterase
MLIFAHRGASGVEPENTLRAIRAALATNVDGVEVDIHQVGQRLLVIHDRWLHRTTSGLGQLHQYSFEELRLLDAGDGEVIPDLEEVLSLISGKCTINLELKNISSLSVLYRYLRDAISKYNFSSSQILISSFNHRLLHKIKQEQAQFPLGALTSCYPLEYAKFAEDLSARSVHLDIEHISQTFVNDAHNRGLKVFVYTVDELEDINEMRRLGVDGVFSNFPTKIKSHLAHLNCTDL